MQEVEDEHDGEFLTKEDMVSRLKKLDISLKLVSLQCTVTCAPSSRVGTHSNRGGVLLVRSPGANRGVKKKKLMQPPY